MPVTFEWEARKAARNLAKHGVSFEEASTSFLDPLGKVHGDPDHSRDETRHILVAHSSMGRVLLVSFTYRRSRVRLISALPSDQA